MKPNAFAASGILAVLTACATPPDRIAASAYPTDGYRNMECPALLAEQASKKSELLSLEAAQRATVNSDAVGVFLVGIPIGSLGGGDVETQVSVAKGQLEAINQTIWSSNCAR